MRWFLKNSYGSTNLYMCSNCNFEYYDAGYAKYKYCPNCGWYMEPSFPQHSSKVKVKRIPKKCCKTCRYSSLKNIAYVKDGGNLQYTQKRYCFAEKEPIEVKDDWGADCDKWKPIEKAVSNQ